MWVFTKHGFLSAVEHRDKPDTLIIRCRVRADLNNMREFYFRKMSKTEFNESADYPYRATISKKDFAKGMTRVIKDLTYDNFKDEVKYEQGAARANIYMRVWSTLIDLEIDPRRIKKYFNKFSDRT
jgi:hypothetical protein